MRVKRLGLGIERNKSNEFDINKDGKLNKTRNDVKCEVRCVFIWEHWSYRVKVLCGLNVWKVNASKRDCSELIKWMDTLLSGSVDASDQTRPPMTLSACVSVLQGTVNGNDLIYGFESDNGFWMHYLQLGPLPYGFNDCFCLWIWRMDSTQWIM